MNEAKDMNEPGGSESNDNQQKEDEENDGSLHLTPDEAEAIKQSVNAASDDDSETNQFEQESLRQSDDFDKKTEKQEQETSHDPLASIGGDNLYSVINDDYSNVAFEMNIPMFIKYVKKPIGIFNQKSSDDDNDPILLDKSMLNEGFNLELQDANIKFDFSNPEDTTIDLKKSGKDDYVPVRKNNSEILNDIRKYFVDLSPIGRKRQLLQKLVKEVESVRGLDSISHSALNTYVEKVISPFDGDQIMFLWDHLYQAKNNIVDKINNLLVGYRQNLFKSQIAKGIIDIEPQYTFLNKVTFAKQELVGVDKGLYAREEKVNGFEERMIQAVADLDSVFFWHRNPERQDGFCINGFINHYPDFIVRMKSGKTVLIETKGDFLDNDDSTRKRELGKEWERLCGRDYRYFMVFESKKVDGALTPSELLDVLKDL